MVNYGCMNLVEIRKEKGLTQKEAASLVGIPYRTYIRYEENPSYAETYKYRKIVEDLVSKTKVDEEHGLLSVQKIKEILLPILTDNVIEFCYLFGSYAKGTATERSDVDLLVDTDITGLAFFRLVEEMRTALSKKVDLLRLVDLKNDNPIIIEILKDGIRLL